MTTNRLAGARLLIVEDEYFLADDARCVLSEVGAEIVGPVATVAEARAALERDAAISGVLLDVNLRGEMAYEIADALQSRRIPFAFITGYDQSALPPRFAETTRLQKPVDPVELVNTFRSLATPAH